MTGVRKPVENPSRRLGEMVSASWFSTVSLSPWKARQTAPSFPHSHSPETFFLLRIPTARLWRAKERSPE